MKIFKDIRVRNFIIHPLNIILLFLINTTIVKLEAGVTDIFGEAAIAFAVIIIPSLVFFYLVNRRVKNPLKVSLILSYILFTTLFFGDIAEFLIYYGVAGFLNFLPDLIGELFFIILLTALFLVLLVYWLSGTRSKLTGLNAYLNILTGIFIVMELAGCASTAYNRVELKEKVALKPPAETTAVKPDIYFIILDEYTGFSALKKFWKYNNSDLKKFLLKNNFFIAENGRAVHNVTNYSLASTFNMTELIFDKKDLYAGSNYISLAGYIKDNPVVAYLNQNGYDFINMSFFTICGKENLYRDIYFLKKGNIYLARTVYGHLYEIVNERFADMADINCGIFSELKTAAASDNGKPKFVYAHIMMPHPPYYFDAKGKRMNLSYSSDKTDLKKYLEQLKYTNRLLMKSVKDILKSSRTPPVIIVQGDHGFRSYTGKDKLEMEYSVLSCFYFPDKDYSMLTDSVKSVNTFRIIFDKYFNQQLALVN